MYYNVTVKEKLMGSSIKTWDFLPQPGKEINQENRKLPNKKGKLEGLLSLTSRAPIFYNLAKWLFLRVEWFVPLQDVFFSGFSIQKFLDVYFVNKYY